MKSTFLPRPFSFFLLTLTCTFFSVQSQEKQYYTGPFQVGEYIGEVDCTFQIKEGDTVLQGPFSMSRTNLEALIGQKDKTFSFTGDFLDGFPNGPWKFQFGEFESDQKTEIVGYQYRVNVDGVQHAASGNISMGRPDGLWLISEKQIEDSQIKETVFQSSISYDKGVPTQSFKIENATSTLVGRFLRDGLAHDDWTLFNDESTETWVFEDGTLTEIRTEMDNLQKVMPIYDKPFGMTKNILLDARFSKLIQIRLPKDEIDIAQSGTLELLNENTRQYQNLNDILSRLGTSEFMPKFQVKVPYFPLDPTENQNLVIISENTKEAIKLASGLLDNTQLNLLIRSDEEAEFLYRVVQRFNESSVQPLQKMVSYKKDGVLDHVNRGDLMNHLFIYGIPSPKISVKLDSGNEREYVGPNAPNLPGAIESFEKLLLVSQYTKESLEDIAKVLYNKVENEQQQQEFEAVEKRMFFQINGLGKVLDSTQVVGEEFSAISTLKQNAEAKLNAYSSQTNNSKKMDQAESLVSCLETYKKIAEQINSLPQKEQEIKEAYMDAVWNPFMANLMDEEIKKRITGAYRNILIPYLLKEVKRDLNCDKAISLNEIFTALHSRMMELRDEDTHKLERKLRREKDPNTILALFNIQPLEE